MILEELQSHKILVKDFGLKQMDADHNDNNLQNVIIKWG